MGQQQLLLLVLGIVIVGVAVVIGIAAFTEGSVRANQDAMTNDVVRIASDAQAWKQKPAPFGGGAGSDAGDFSDLSWAQLGYDVNATGDYENMNGTYAMSFDDGALVITGTSALIRGDDQVTQVVATVSDIRPEDISTVVTVEDVD